MEQIPSCAANRFSASQEILRILCNPEVHYHSQAFTTCLCPLPDQSYPCLFISLIEDPFNIILPPMPKSSKWSLSLRFPYQNSVYTSPVSHTCTCPSLLIPLDFITRRLFDKGYRSLSSLLCSLLHSPVTSSLLGPNIFLSTLFSNTLSLCSSFSVSDQASHPYKTTGKITLFVLIFIFLDSKMGRVGSTRSTIKVAIKL